MNKDIDQNPLYISLINQLEEEICQGIYKPGDKMPGIGAICKKYNVSMTTAVRAVNILKDRKILSAIPKKGTYVKGIPEIELTTDQSRALERIRLVCPFENLQAASFTGEIYQGILEACEQHKLPLVTEHLSIHDLRGINKLEFTPTPEEGVIVISGKPEICQQSLLSTAGLRRVLIDSVNPNSPCVLSDNFNGMMQILKHLKKLGHKQIGLAGKVVTSPNSVNENERHEAFVNICSILELQGSVLEAVTIVDLVKQIMKQDHLSALVFTRDDPAESFLKEARKAGIRVPNDLSVTGFDDISLLHTKSSTGLTTCRVDRKEMGKKAVELLRNHDDENEQFCRWQRVPCQLVVRRSTAQV